MRITGKEHGLGVGRTLKVNTSWNMSEIVQVTSKFTSDNRGKSRGRLNISEDQIVAQVEG